VEWTTSIISFLVRRVKFAPGDVDDALELPANFILAVQSRPLAIGMNATGAQGRCGRGIKIGAGAQGAVRATT
jgi:hypothetical protein